MSSRRGRRFTAGARPGSPYLAGAPLLIAHRGGSALAPENTIEAFRQAIEWWRADILELDVRCTRDGEVVVLHDESVDRTTDGRGPVAGLTLAELRRLDAGYRFSCDGGVSYPYRGRDIRVPTLDEVIEAHPGARINIEIKDAAAQTPVRRLVERAGLERRVLIAAGRRADRAGFGGFSGPVSAAAEDLWSFYIHHLCRATRLCRISVDAFQMPEKRGERQVLSPRLVREAHARNIAVHVWTVDTVADMQRLLSWGVDGLITDRPDRLARVLHEHIGRPLPAGPPAGEAPPSVERLLLA